MKKDILLYNSPLNVAIEEQPASLQLELFDLFHGNERKWNRVFFRNLSSERFTKLRTCGLRMTSTFGSTYFFYISIVKSRHRSLLTNYSFLSLLRLATTQSQVDIQSLVADSECPHSVFTLITSFIKLQLKLNCPNELLYMFVLACSFGLDAYPMLINFKLKSRYTLIPLYVNFPFR